MKAAIRPLSRLLRDLFRLEPLEPRILLSADPVLGAVALVAAPPQEQAAALLQAYSPRADQVVATQPGDTVLVTQGPARHAQPGWLVVDASQLAGGNGTLVIGGPDSDARILIGEEGGPDVMLGNLVLLNPGAGGEVVMQSRLVVSGELITVGSGHTDIVNADESAGSIVHIDSMEIGGDRILTATDAAGNIQLGTTPGIKFVNGNNDAVADTLTLRADGNVSIYNTFTGSDLLEGLTIGARTEGGTDLPSSVRFYDTVSLNGDLVIEVESTGSVIFDNLVTIKGTGNVHITGAGTVQFAGGLFMDGTGNVFIEGNEIDFGTSTEAIRGSGVLTLRPTTPGNAIEVGSMGGPTASTLNLDTTDLAALGDGFSKIVIGHESGGHAAAAAGAVRVGAGVAPNPLLRDPVEIYGSTVTVEDPNSSLDRMVVNGTIKLDAVGNIVIKGAMSARDSSGSGTSDITLWSQSGSVTQIDSLDDNNDASEPIRGALLTVRAATGISLPFTELASVSATNATSGDLSIVETATGADINVILLSQAGNAANLSLRTTSGSITVNGGISHAGTGLIELDAAGTGKQVTIKQAIASAGGAIRINATGLITTDDDGAATDGTVVTAGDAAVDIVSSEGAIVQGGLVESAGGEVRLQAASALTMGTGSTVRSLDGVGNTGIVRLIAGTGSATLAAVQADGNIFVTAGSAILGLVSSNPHLDGETAAVLLAAASGIGATTGTTTTLQTRVQSLGATNTATGGIFVREATALTLTSTGAYAVDAGGTGGAISVVTTEGTLTIAQAVRSTGAAGHILLQAGETIEGTTADLAVNASVGSTSGSISLAAADNLTIAAAATVSTSGNATQFVDVRADGSLTMDATAGLAATGGGAVWVAATAGEAVLGTLDAGTGRAFVSAGTNILDAADDDATPGVNITGGQVRLDAGGAIGGAGALLETSAATLAARSSGGGLFLSEADALSLGTVGAATSSRVAADGTVASAAGAADLAGLDSAGALVLQAGGNLTVPVAVQAAGNLRLHAGGTLDVSAAVASSGGHASVVAAGQLDAAATASFETLAAGMTLDLASTAGALAMSDGAQARTNAGALRVQAFLDATLGRIDARSSADRAGNTLAGQAGWGSVSITAGGALGGNPAQVTPDVFASQLRLQGSGIGTDPVNLQTEAALLSASAGASGLFVQEATALQLGTTAAITVHRVGLDGGDGAAQTDAALAGVTSLGALVLRTTAGSVTGDASGAVSAAGNVLVQAGGAASDIDLDAAVGSTAGHLSLAAGQDLLLDGNVTTGGSGKTIDLLAARHVTLAQGRSVASTDGHIAIEATAGTVTLEQLSAGSGDVRIAGAAIVDGDAAGDTEVDVLAAGALLTSAGAIGAAGAQLETTVTTLTAQAAGGVYLLESDGLTVASLQVNVQRVAASGATAATAHAAQEDLSGTSVLLTSTTGSLVVQAGTAASAGVTSTAGAVRLEAAAGALQVEASIDAGAGSLSLLGAGAVTLGLADAIVLSGGTVDLDASGGSLSLAANASVRTDGGAIRAHAGGDLLISVLDARTTADRNDESRANQASWGSVSVSAGGSITDHAGDTAVNLFANALRLNAGNGIGTGAQPVETEAALLSASAGADGMFLREASALAVGSTPAIGVTRPAADGASTASVADGAQAGLVSGGALVLATGEGALTLAATGAVTAASHLRLAAGGAASDLTVGAQVQSTGGHMSLAAGRHLALDANVLATGASRTLELSAGGNLMQAQGTSASTSDGNLSAVAGGTLTVESMVAGTAALHASGAAIVDGDAAGDSETDFAAGSLRMLSTGAIGASDNAIETEAGLLAARATGQVFVTEADALAVGTLGAVQVQQVDLTGATIGFDQAGGSGLAGSDVVLRALDGSFTLSGTGTVNATGNLLLQAGGLASNLAIGAGVTATGSVSLLAGADVTVSSAVAATDAAATLDVQGARIVAQQGSSLSTNDGNVSLAATGTVTLESISAGAGAVRIAGNRVEDGDAAGDTEVDITAAQLAITAGDRIGLGANALETTVGTASLRAGSNVFVTETDALVLDTVTVGVNRVGADGVAAAQAPVAQSNNTGAAFVLRTVAGALTSTAAGGSVTAAGNVLLQAGGATSDLALGGAVSSSAGSISLDAGASLLQNANISTAQASATIDLLAGGAISQGDGSSVSSNNGHVALQAGAAVTLELVSAGAGRVSIAGTTLLDGDADGDSDVDVAANGVKLTASQGAIGAGANALELTTSTLSAFAGNGGGIFITETDALLLDTVAVSVQRVAANSSTSAQNSSQGNMTGGVVVVRTLGGSLSSQTAGIVSATGNVLLQAGGASSDLTLGAAASTSGGSFSILAGRDLVLAAAGSASAAAGHIEAVAAGAVTMAAQSSMGSGGLTRVQSGGNATIAGLSGATVEITSGAAILDGGDVSRDVTAATARLSAAGDIGGFASEAAALDLAVGTLAAHSAGGTIQLAEADALTLGSVATSGFGVDAQGNTVALASAALLGLRGGNGTIELRAGGTVTLAADAVQAAIASTGTVRVIAAGAVADSGNAFTDIAASELSVQANGGSIGSGLDAVEIAATQLAATAAGAVHFWEADQLTVTQLAATATGPVVLRSASDLTITGAATASAGNLLLESTTGSVSVQATAAASAYLGVLAAADVILGATGALVSSGGTIDIESTGAAVAMAHGALAQTQGGNVRARASTSLTVGLIDARTQADRGAGTLATQDQWGSVSLRAGGAIADNAGELTVDIYARHLRLQAGSGIAEPIETEVVVASVDAGTGGALLTDATALELGTSAAMLVRRIGADGTTLSDVSDAAQSGLASGAAVSIDTLQGALTMSQSLTAAGHVHLAAAAGTVVLDAALDAGIGSVTVLGVQGVALGAGGSIATAGGTIDIESTTGAVAMAGGSYAQTDGGAIRVSALQDVSVSLLDARTAADRTGGTLTGQSGWGDASLIAGGSILDAAADLAIDVHANALRLQAGTGIGAGATHVGTEAALLSASAGTAGLFVAEASALEVGQTPDLTVQRVAAGAATASGLTDLAQAGLASAGVAVLQTTEGALSVTRAVNVSGNLLLKTTGAGTGLTVAAAVNSSGGNISLLAAGDLALEADVGTTAIGRSIELRAGGDWTQAQGTSVSTIDGNIGITGGVITVASIVAGAGAVNVSGNQVLDVDASGDALVDIAASSLSVLGLLGIGAAGNALETSVEHLAARGNADVFITESTGVAVGSVVDAVVRRVAGAGSDSALGHLFDQGLSGNDVVLVTVDGGIATSGTGAVTASGNVLLQAGGLTSSLVLGAGVTATGSVSLLAGADVTVSSAVAATDAAATLDVQGARIVAQQGSSLSTNDGNVSLAATGTVTLESISAGAGAVRIAGNRVEDGDAAGDTEVDITAAQLAITAGDRIGLGANALETTVGTASLRAGSNVFVTETDALVLDTVTVGVNRVGDDGIAAAQAPVAQSNNTGAAFVLRTVAGALSSTAAGGSVTAAGNVLLQAGGATSDLTLGGAVSSSAGSISLDAGASLLQNANISTAQASATIDLLAGGAISQGDGSSVSSNNGHVALQAGAAVTLELVSAGAGRVSIAGTTLLDGDADGDSDVDVAANGVKLTASQGAIGAGANALELTTSTLSAFADNGGGIFITETDALLLEAVAVSVQRVNADSSTSAQDSDQADVAGGVVVVRTLGGSLSSQAGGIVTAAGNLLLEAGGAASDLVIGVAASTSSGDLSLAAGRDLILNADVGNTGDGTLDLVAQGAFTQAQGSAVSTAGGNLALQAGGVATLEKLDVGAGQLRVSAGGIADGDAAGDSEVDLLAADARLVSTGAIGAAGAELETSVALLAAQATSHLFVTETDALQIGTLAVDVQRVLADGSTAAPVDGAIGGLSGQNVVLRTLDGALQTLGLASVSASGNLLLAAGGSAGDLTAGASITAAGALSLSAGRNMVLASTVSTTTAGSTIDLLAQGALTAQEGSSIVAIDADVQLQAAGNLTIDAVAAGTGAIRLQGADIVDGDGTAGETEVDVTGAQLQVTASGAVGATANALETTIATLSISAAGSITLAESDALAIDSTSVTVNRVGIDGATTATPAVVQQDVTSTGGSIALTAQGAIDLPANADVRTSGAATITLTSATGAVLMQAGNPGQSIIETGSGDIRVIAEGDIRPGALLTTGNAYLDSANGSILIAGDLQRDGEDIDLLGDDLAISVPVESDGATLRIGPLTTGTVVVVGNVALAGVLQVDTTELGLLQDGFAQIVIGSALDNQSVQLEGNGLGNALVFTDPLVLLASGDGGTISISGALQGDTLTVQDAGVGTTLTGATVQMQGALTVQDQLSVSGANSLQAGLGGAALLQLAQAVTGAGGAADTLALSANGGNVRLDQAVSNLDGMTISAAADVTFDSTVTLDGDLVIEATGTVTFNGLLTLGSNGRLVVRGGGQVVFAAGANLGTGDASLEVSGLLATGGAGSITGQGTLAISGATAGMALHLGAGAGAGLVIGETALAALGNGFGAIQFGSGVGAGAGAVTLGSADLRATDAAISVLGSSIAVNAGGAGLQVDSNLALRSDGAVTTAGRIVASAAADVALTSNAGAVTMAAGASIVSAGGRIDLAAAGSLSVAGLDARNGAGGAGSVNLRSTSGVIVDANADTAVDVYAQAVDFIGAGPAAGDVLEVAAPIVRVEPGAGLLLRESGADGRTYYNVLRGGAVQQALVAVGPSVRVTSDPDNFVGDPGLLQDMGLAFPLAPASFQASQLSASFQGGAAGSLAAASGAGAGTTQVGSYLAAGSSMVAPELSTTFGLLADGSLAFASGQPAGADSGVDWWLESVEL